MTLDQLQSTPAGVDESNELIEELDACLYSGFARLGPESRQALETLASTMAASPLGSPLAEAIAAVGRSEFLASHFLTLAAARAALQGAQYDALVHQARAALGVAVEEIDESPATVPGELSTILNSAAQWLTEIALAGFKHLDEESIAPFAATLERLQDEPKLTRLAALLTGFFNELLLHMPAEKHPDLPVFRWADLWTGAMVRTKHLPGDEPFQAVSGELMPLGLDVQSHGNFVCAILYGCFESADGRRAVRVPLSGYKVDVIVGAEVWELFGDTAAPLLQAISGHKSLKIDSAELRGGGDLILKAKPKVGRAFDPFDGDGSEPLPPLPLLPPLFRHPVHVAELIRLAEKPALPIADERVGAVADFNTKLLGQATAMIGLLRFDRGGWRVQPLCVQGKKGFVMSGEALAAQHAKLKAKSLPILRERASKLLRG